MGSTAEPSLPEIDPVIPWYWGEANVVALPGSFCSGRADLAGFRLRFGILGGWEQDLCHGEVADLGGERRFGLGNTQSGRYGQFMRNSEEAGKAEDHPGDPANQNWRAVLHQLNNIFASIHSSLDLAAANSGRPEARPFLEQAQESARRGALLVNDLRFGGREGGGSELKATKGELPRSGAETVPTPLAASMEGSERILLVDDDEPVRLLIRAVLTYRGYDVTEACDGEEAVKRYQEFGPFDLLILDLHMPKLDGRSALERIRAVDPKVRALALSGSVFDRGQDCCDEQLGAFDARLNKPFDNTELVALVRRLLDHNEAACGASDREDGIPAL